MNSEIEQIIEKTKQLSTEDKLQLIESIGNPTKVEAANPWLAIAGSLSDDPFFEDYIAEIERYRQELDREAINAEDDRAA
jgi:hypothetical protein